MARGFGASLARFAVAALLLGVRPCAAAGAPAATRWPRSFDADGMTVVLHQPQGDRWYGGWLQARAAVAVTKKGEGRPLYGALWVRAKTATDEGTGLVTLDGVEVLKGTFPWERDGGKDVVEAIRARIPDGLTIPLASLGSVPGADEARPTPTPAPPPTPPPLAPRVIHARGPALLVLVDGNYDIRPVPGTKVLRVVNTRVLLLQDAASSRFSLPVAGRWLVAPAPNGKWTVAKKWPRDLDVVRKSAAAEPDLERLDDPGADVAAAVRTGKAPAVIVSTTPAVLSSKMPKAVRPPAAPAPASVRLPATASGGLFVGPDGNVYRPRGGGGWDKTNGRDWYPVQEPRGYAAGVTAILDRERSAREGRLKRPRPAAAPGG